MSTGVVEAMTAADLASIVVADVVEIDRKRPTRR
jgi:hypothetical protein